MRPDSSGYVNFMSTVILVFVFNRFPLFRPGTFKAIVTTHGLKWDLMNTQTGFGGLISSSNEVVDESNGVVEISTDSWLVWTTHMNGKGFRTCLSSSSI